MDHSPIEMILYHLLEGPGNGALLRIKRAIEVDVVLLLQVPADEGRIGDDLALVVNVRELALRRLLEAGRVGPIGKLRHFEQHFHFGHEGAWVWQTKSRSEAIERDHSHLTISLNSWWMLSPPCSNGQWLFNGIITSIHLKSHSCAPRKIDWIPLLCDSHRGAQWGKHNADK